MEDLLSLVELPDWKSILLDIVHREGFDPWNIDVEALARAYLRRIQQMRELNLSVPANAVLACSILLSMKARRLREFYADWLRAESNCAVAFAEEPEPLDVPMPGAQEEREEEEIEARSAEQAPAAVVPQRVIPRRLTLDEIISAVERVMLARRKIRTPPPPPPVEDMFEKMEREAVDELLDEVYGRVREMCRGGSVPFSRIVPDRSPETIVRYLLALLYLANEGKLLVEQDEPFGEIRVVVRDGSQTHS